MGGAKEGKKGRSYSTKKQKAAVVVELAPEKKVKRLYVKAIGDHFAKSPAPIFEDHVPRSGKVVTDQWKGYLPLKKKHEIEQMPSRKGKDFKELHIVVHHINHWLRIMHRTIPMDHVSGSTGRFSGHPSSRRPLKEWSTPNRSLKWISNRE
jgi:hypothetical protein